VKLFCQVCRTAVVVGRTRGGCGAAGLCDTARVSGCCVAGKGGSACCVLPSCTVSVRQRYVCAVGGEVEPVEKVAGCCVVVPAGNGRVLACLLTCPERMVTVNRPARAACCCQGFRLPGSERIW